MSSEPQATDAAELRPASGSLLHGVCLPFLRKSQNQDGGWGYRLDHRSGVEATCWTLGALAAIQDAEADRSAIERGCSWLDQMQLPDGSWPEFAGQRTGTWTTALACLVLHRHGESPDRVARGLTWLCKTRPGESGLWWRIR